MNGAAQNDRRASAALMILLIVLLIVGAGGFVGAAILQDKQFALDTRQAQLDMLRQRKPAPANGGAPQIKLTVKPFLAEESYALAANALQQRVVGAIEDAQGKLVTVSVDPPIAGDENLARRISVQVTAELTNEALQKVLYELESAVPFVFVESFTATRLEAADKTAKTAVEAEPRIRLSLNVTGYRRKGSP